MKSSTIVFIACLFLCSCQESKSPEDIKWDSVMSGNVRFLKHTDTSVFVQVDTNRTDGAIYEIPATTINKNP